MQQQPGSIDMTALAAISHPYAEFSAADAVTLANSHQRLNKLSPVSTVNEAREVVADMARRIAFNWETGKAALDVLDAAIDGLDIAKNCRLLGTH